MFALMQNPNYGTTTIVSMNSNQYPELCFMGYKQLATGFQKSLETIQEEMMELVTDELEMNEIN